jgi:DNA-binding response OmpR family regulator
MEVGMAKILLAIKEYPSIRDLLSEELAEWGYVVVSTGDPNLISELLRTFDPDLIIMDPYVRGEMHCDLLERIRNQKPHLPILIFSDPYKEDSHQFQVDGWVAKSFLFDNLKQKIIKIEEKPHWNPAQPNS